MNVELISITPDAERTMVYVARVSNPANQENPEYAKLLKYCITHQHWSVFEHAHMTLEIETSLAIATQILRHRSFTFQQFSQRYAPLASDSAYEHIELRLQAEKNRQSSTRLVDEVTCDYFMDRIKALQWDALELYYDMVDTGIARECARMVLLQCTQTRLYMTGTIRSWIHYLQLRTQPDTQLEHRRVAEACQSIFIIQLPVVATALGWWGDNHE